MSIICRCRQCLIFGVVNPHLPLNTSSGLLFCFQRQPGAIHEIFLPFTESGCRNPNAARALLFLMILGSSTAVVAQVEKSTPKTEATPPGKGTDPKVLFIGNSHFLAWRSRSTSNPLPIDVP